MDITPEKNSRPRYSRQYYEEDGDDNYSGPRGVQCQTH